MSSNIKVETKPEVNYSSTEKTVLVPTKLCSTTEIKPRCTNDEFIDETIDPIADKNNEVDFCLQIIPEEHKETYQSYLNDVEAMAAVPIIQSISEESICNFNHYNLRYFEDKYCINFNVKEKGYNDTLIRIHTNKLLLVALASGNDILTSGKDIVDINFVINKNDRANITLKGKKKRGSKVVEPHTILCQIKCKEVDKVYNVRAGVNGRIIEINDHIKSSPNLLRKYPKGMGFIAVVALHGNPAEYEERICKLGLLSGEEYLKHLNNRPPPTQ